MKFTPPMTPQPRMAPDIEKGTVSSAHVLDLDGDRLAVQEHRQYWGRRSQIAKGIVAWAQPRNDRHHCGAASAPRPGFAGSSAIEGTAVTRRRGRVRLFMTQLRHKPSGRGNRYSAVQEELCGPDLYQNGFRELCRQVIQEDADRWQQALPVGNESRDRGIASKPGRQHPPQGSRSNFVATDIAGHATTPRPAIAACFRPMMSSLKSRGAS